MLSANLFIDRKKIKELLLVDYHVYLDGKPLRIELALYTKCCNTEELRILLGGHQSKKLKRFLDSVHKARGWWSQQQCIEGGNRANCFLQGDHPKGKSWTFTVFSKQKLAIHGHFTCVLDYWDCGWELVSVQTAEQTVDQLARGLDINGWRLPNHWYQSLCESLK